MENFSKYHSIPNHSHVSSVNRITFEGLDKLKYACVEKVHGANFSFWYDGTTMQKARRSGYCDDSFFSCDKVSKYEPSIVQMYERMVALGEMEQGQTLVTYGELFGGEFYGDSNPTAKNIQGGMNYHPDVEFIMFDIWVKESDHYVSLLGIQSYGEEFGIPVCPVHFAGTFEECLKLDNEVETLVPEVFNLVKPEGAPINMGEGFVIRPIEGDPRTSKGQRPIFKSKNGKFGGGSSKTAKAPMVLTPECEKVFGVFTCYITKQRAQEVQSKIGFPVWKDVPKVAGLLFQDAMDAYDEDIAVPELICTLKQAVDNEWKAFNMFGMRFAAEIVREMYKEVL